MTLPALAGPWTYEQYEMDGEMDGNSAYQFEESSDDYVLAYDCDALFGFESIILQTPEAYDDSASYPEAVATLFTIDGKDYPASGKIENRDGYVFVFYDDLSDENIGDVFGAMERATSRIELSVNGSTLTFSAEGVAEAIGQAVAGCGF